MLIVFLSNYFNHHQSSLCESFINNSDVQFFFIETNEMPLERKKMGWDNNTSAPYYVLNIFSKESDNVILNADFIIWGDAPYSCVKKYLKNKIVFRYTERIFKKISLVNFIVQVYRSIRFHYRNKNLFLLSASGFASFDYGLIGAFNGRKYKWGYFPKLIIYDINELLAKKEKDYLSILFVSRFLKWKHPEIVVNLAQKLKKDGYCFHITMIGKGPIKESIASKVRKNNLFDSISFIESDTPQNIRHYMEKANVFLMTSDRNEGWGAVVNEAMNSGCVVLSSNKVGSQKYLIQHGENGYIFKDRNVNNLCSLIEKECFNEEKRRIIGTNAYKTISTLWNSDIAANRLVSLFKSMQNKSIINFDDGPCSRC